MGTFNWAMEIRSADGQRVETVEALVDTSSSYTILPVETLRRLGLLPTSTRRFELGDGRIIELDIGEARIRLGGEEYIREEHTRIVVFGSDPASYILGADTLQGRRASRRHHEPPPDTHQLPAIVTGIPMIWTDGLPPALSS